MSTYLSAVPLVSCLSFENNITVHLVSIELPHEKLRSRWAQSLHVGAAGLGISEGICQVNGGSFIQEDISERN